MVKSNRRPSPKGGSDYSLDQIDKMEKLSLKKANKAISAIENAIAVWEASPDKPEDLKLRMIRLKHFYDAIKGWERKALQTVGKSESIGERVDRLKEFSDICFTYA